MDDVFSHLSAFACGFMLCFWIAECQTEKATVARTFWHTIPTVRVCN